MSLRYSRRCDSTHANTNVGLVETLVGLIPSGGGCKEMLYRWTVDAKDYDDRLSGALKVFEIIGMAKTASSPIKARSLRMFLQRDHYCMNRDRLLVESKTRALELADGYIPPEESKFIALGTTGLEAMQEMINQMESKGITTPHDLVVANKLAWILSGGDRSAGEVMSENDVLELEREAFIALCKTPATIARIDHMLTKGKPLRN